ncbi:MAG TPA: hypothetical protein VMV94_16820 [Phycisphaerae bacterium]|nr:hypothetical protein [Phycisphaerae bacterium]
MKSLATSLLCGVFVCGLAASAAQADDKVDSPIYKHWAKFKPGAYSELRTERTAKDVKAEISTMTILREVTPEKIVIVVRAVTLSKEGEITIPPKRQEFPAKVEKADADKMGDPKKGDKIDDAEVLDVKQSEDEIKFGDEKIKCKLLETKSKQGEQTTTTKAWTSDEVPGQIVKMEVTLEGPAEMTSKTSLVKYSVDGGSAKTDKSEKADDEKANVEKKEQGDEKAPADKKDEREKKEQKGNI